MSKNGRCSELEQPCYQLLPKRQCCNDKKIDDKTLVILHFDSQEEKKEFLKNKQALLPQNVSLAPNIKFTYQNDNAEKQKYEAMIKALNR